MPLDEKSRRDASISSTCVCAGNVDVHAISRLTLNVITQNLTMALGTTLSETLVRSVARESTQTGSERGKSHLSTFTAAGHS